MHVAPRSVVSHHCGSIYGSGEREALHRGADAVFKSDDDFPSVVMNVRAICGLG
jgi:hypothetical protein